MASLARIGIVESVSFCSFHLQSIFDKNQFKLMKITIKLLKYTIYKIAKIKVNA